MSELEKGLKEQLESVIKQNQILLEKHFQQDSKIVKLIEENIYYKNKLQQKENIINEFDKWIDEESEKTILSTGHLTCLMMCKSKLQELKGSEKK